LYVDHYDTLPRKLPDQEIQCPMAHSRKHVLRMLASHQKFQAIALLAPGLAKLDFRELCSLHI